MTSSLLHSGNRTTKSRASSRSPQVVSWENPILELLQEFPMSSTFEIVVSLCPGFWEQTVTARTILWQEISATLSRMLAQGSISVAVDQVQVAHWSLEPSGSGRCMGVL